MEELQISHWDTSVDGVFSESKLTQKLEKEVTKKHADLNLFRATRSYLIHFHQEQSSENILMRLIRRTLSRRANSDSPCTEKW